MKLLNRVGVRRLVLMAPFALLIIFAIAVSGPVTLGGAVAYGPPGTPIPPPVPGFWAAPVPPAFNAILSV